MSRSRWILECDDDTTFVRQLTAKTPLIVGLFGEEVEVISRYEVVPPFPPEPARGSVVRVRGRAYYRRGRQVEHWHSVTGNDFSNTWGQLCALGIPETIHEEAP